jgi:hypothetical protein
MEEAVFGIILKNKRGKENEDNKYLRQKFGLDFPPKSK